MPSENSKKELSLEELTKLEPESGVFVSKESDIPSKEKPPNPNKK